MNYYVGIQKNKFCTKKGKNDIFIIKLQVKQDYNYKTSKRIYP